MRILLVRLRLIGDVVFTTPLIRALRRRYPGASLTYVVEPAAAPVVNGNPHLQRVMTLPKSSGLARLREDCLAARTLRRERFDIAIDLHGGPRSAWLTWASGAPRRIGYTIPGRTWMYTDVVERPTDPARHSVENQWALLGPLGVPPCDPATDSMEMTPDPSAAARVTTLLHEAGVGSGAPLIVVHVSAGNPFRRWPATSFGAVIEHLARQDPSRRIIVTSGPSEAAAAGEIAAQVRARLGSLAACVPELRELDLLELHSLVARASLYIGGDSGPMHIAATTTTPVVGLLGPTLASRSMPWRNPAYFSEAVETSALPCRPCHQRVCEPGDFRCLTRITPERVVEAAERGLAQTAHTHASREPHVTPLTVSHT